MNNNLTLKTKLQDFVLDVNNNQVPASAPTEFVTGDDTVDFAKEIEALLGDAAGTQQTQTQSQPIEVDVAGHKLKFDDNKQLSQRLTEIVNNFQLSQRELQELRARVSQQPVAQPDANAKVNPKEFSNEQFSTLLQSGDNGVAAALNYAMNHMFFNGSVPDAAKTISALLQQSAATAQDLTVLRFKDAHPELPRTAETGQTLETIRNKYNLPFTPEGLEASYALAKHLGAIQPVTQTESVTPQQPTPQQAMINNFASPVLSRQSGAPPQTNTQLTQAQIDRAWEIPLDQLEKLVYKYRGTGVN